MRWPLALPQGEPWTEVVNRLGKWDLGTGLECRECALFRLWMKELGDPQWVYARATQGSEQERAAFFVESKDALSRALGKAKALSGAQNTPWVRWGDVHRALFPGPEAVRPFAVSDPARALATAGDDQSVAPGSSDFIEEGKEHFFSHHSGASQRVIWEMTDPPQVHFVLPDNPERRKAWAECRFYTIQD